ncbi:pimeloyl-ACP methyl ester esterase BioH [Rouxiella silvae]|uniref:Pimeloyl-[acyl-carrier protein] methyl ester esterase n=1 Tax=Rouxiella silvae TaxID=1646373 RepID=A0AA40X527_9GAMM|nr:pimeloyl-ACP methyl ester esterase BioH [Rouxiella silvae]MBF6638372.1 pimeloyl-ACP methyl ester esterase BioH [Rouxiella silvae]
MNRLYWQTLGEGSRDIVLLHGWGLNAEVWRYIAERWAPHFRLHLVDLPGYGRSQGFGALSLSEMTEIVLAQAPEKALWLGWSLGGLVASQAALVAPMRVEALITVSSSPRFAAEGEQEGKHTSESPHWPGIRHEVLQGFQHQLSEDFQRTVERFLALQTLGSESARQDAKLLKSMVLDLPMPPVEVLNGGLDILNHQDLRMPMKSLRLPFLRIYGALDGLVPRKIAPLLDTLWPASHSVIIEKASHAPFISHPDAFSSAVLDFLNAENLR